MENNNNSVENLALNPRIIEQLVGASPPHSNWLSSTMFPEDSAFFVQGDDEEFLAAHPHFWSTVGDRAAKIGIIRPWQSIKVITVDNEAGDTIAQREAKREVRMRFAAALCQQLRRQGDLQ